MSIVEILFSADLRIPLRLNNVAVGGHAMRIRLPRIGVPVTRRLGHLS
ncbi:hypothetical protein ACFYTF_30940 [Nocardia thailandica]|uniref:Uncharacterized protein n=1 Tax=Nocardia thailandica TaxID=257275 RepID=A0ABW6PXW5_9NOCA